MTRRSRILAYGTAAGLVLAGVGCGVLIAGGTGQLLAVALTGVGLVGLVSLVFLEIGLSEDRDRELRRPAPPVPRHSRRPARPDRLRGQRRRLP